MSKTDIKSTTFTPLFHNVLDQHGITTAAVFGRVWQYCQMERGYCHAEQETIAYQLGINRKTVNLSLGILVQMGYLSDVTPNTKGRTRIYKDTGKAGGKVYEDVTEPVTDLVTEVETSPVTEPVTKSNTNIEKKEKKKSTPATQANNSVVAGDFLNSLNEIQRKSYNLARQVASHDIALSKAMSETPVESAISLLEWHRENSTPNARVAQTLLEKFYKEERREASIKEFEDNIRDMQDCLETKAEEYFGNMPTVEFNNLWKAYIESCVPLYKDKDQYDICADGAYNREGADGLTHYKRMELFVKERANSNVTI